MSQAFREGLGFFREGAAKVGDFFRSLPEGYYRPADPSIASEALRKDVSMGGEADADQKRMIVAGSAGGEGKVNPRVEERQADAAARGPVQEPTDARSNALTTAVTNVGTGAETEEDTEGLLKGLFGRSYKPMDDGALALINLGAGIAKGDITGGMQSAVTAMGEERDRRRKEDLSSAQAEFYRSGEKGASKATMRVMREKAVRTIDDMGYTKKRALLSQILGTKPTREQMDDPVLEERMIDLLAYQYAQQEQISSRSGARQNPSQLAGNRGTGNNTVDKARIVQLHNSLIGQ